MNFVIGLVIALFMFLVVGSILIGTVFDAQAAAEGCGPISSLIADISAGGVEAC